MTTKPDLWSNDQLNSRVFDKEKFQQEFRQELLLAVKSGKPININELIQSIPGKETPLGDTIIVTHLCYSVIRELCAASKQVFPNALKFSKRNGYPLGSKVDMYVHEVNADADESVRSKLEEYAMPIFSALGLKLPAELLQQPPVLHRVEGFSALQDFSYEDVLKKSDDLEKNLQGQRPILLCQAGSISYKRFSDEQMMQLEARVYEENFGKKVIILRDSEIRDINTLAAYFMVSEKIITTDTSWAWIAGAVRQLQQVQKRVPSDLVVFHSVTNEYWHVPGAQSIYSPATELMDDEMHGMMMPFHYANYSQGKDLWEYTKIKDIPTDLSITTNDFEDFLKRISS